jgi:hypothetical protein
MNSPAQTISDPPPSSDVEIRPLKQGERAIFFDRKRDSDLLGKKVLSARFTVLYGPSGVGKSFVLQNLLIPDLEKQNACVIYFKDWQSDDPTSEIKAKFVAEAEKLKIPEPEAGRPSLTNLVRLLMIAGDRPVVLILDQFEEFFGIPDDRQDSLRKELGILAGTPDLDVRVLLSLREQEKEKQLGSLEPFQATIPNLFQSTYRLTPGPYVGMRPFMRGEEAIFFGRNRDATLLRDKVLSARITVLYGLSGVGKSSILHLLLTPLLEKEGARVIYFDKWRGEDPTALLASRLVKAASLTVSEPAGDRPNLTELVRLMLKAENRTVVLILDQFEEFFLDAPSARLSALRQELGQLVSTSDLDVKVLLSLREEHLAALEPFRSTILNLLQSTHRLEHLTGANAREAIEGPAKNFGAQYNSNDPDFINILLNDLLQKQPEAKPGQPPPEIDVTPVDLPMLQLLCEELWKETIAREAMKKITGPEPIVISQSLYQKELEGRQGIQDRYLRRVMPDHWGDKKVTAQLMKPLAPRSGHKRPFSAEELSEETKLPLDRVQSELERLSGPDVRVLRSRKYGAGPVLYELCHDSFISIIAPWRDEILRDIERRGRFWRKIAWAAVILGTTAIVVPVVLWLVDWDEFSKNTERRMASTELGETETEKFDNATDYLLKRERESKFFDLLAKYLYVMRKGPEPFDIVKDFLVKNQGALPDDYGMPPPEKKGDIQDDSETRRQAEEWPLEVHYPATQKLNRDAFMQVWKLQAAYLTKKLGIPVPLELKMVEEGYQEEQAISAKELQRSPSEARGKVRSQKTLIKFTGENIGSFEAEIPPEGGYLVAITSENLLTASKGSYDRLLNFVKSRNKEWDDVDSVDREEQAVYLRVPRWSLPVWKHFKILIADTSVIPVLRLAEEMQKHPDRLLTPDAVEILLNKVAVESPQTVAEARAVRGSRLPEDFQEIVKHNIGKHKQALPYLPTLLDALANYPEGSSADIVAQVLSEVSVGPAPLPVQPRGPNKAGGPRSKAELRTLLAALANYPEGSPENIAGKVLEANLGAGTQGCVAAREIHPAYQEASILLPKMRNPKIRVYIGDDLVAAWTKENDLGPELRDQVEKIRDRLARRFGIFMPGVRFIAESDIDKNAFSIEATNQSEGDPGTAPVHVGKDMSLEPLRTALLFSAESHRSHFLNADVVSWDLQDMKPALRSWLQSRYSLTDLKLLLKLVITPTNEEQTKRAKALKAGGRGITFNVPQEHSIRQREWLLASLLFWTKVHNHKLRLLPDMARDLQKTQGARLNPKPDSLKNPEIDKIIAKGVEALGQGRLPEAEAAFVRAVKAGKDAAVFSFLVLYPQELRRSLIKKLTAQSLEESEISQADRIELEDLLAEEDLDKSVGTHAARRLNLRLLATSSTNVQVRRQMAVAILERYNRPEEWPPDEAAWFGKNLLTWFDLLAKDNALPQKGLYFLNSALPRLSDPKVIDHYADFLMKKCGKKGPNQWCWELLPALAGPQIDPGTSLDIAYLLATRKNPADLELSLVFVEQARKKLPAQNIKEEERARLLEWADYLQARTMLRKEESAEGRGQGIAEAEKILLSLKDTKSVGNLASLELACLRMRQKRPEEATAIIDEAMQKRPETSGDLFGENLALKLVAGDKEGVTRVATEALSKVKKDAQGKMTQETADFAYLGAGGLLMAGAGWEQVAREVMQTDNYIAMMLYWRLASKGDAGAREVIEARWSQAKPETWKARMSQGDITVWEEMLIGYYNGKVTREEILADLEDDARFAKSLSHLPQKRQALLCDVYFYGALLAESKGDKTERNISLKKAVATNMTDYFEYAMAKFLLAQPSESK